VVIATVEVAAPLGASARPWPGLIAFTEAVSQFFFGREIENDELFRLVRRDLVTLLFGQSGLGKTSLLQAGLVPRLRWAGFLPILIRLDHSAGAPSPSAQVRATIEREFAAANLSEATPMGADESLWGYFHRVDTRLADYAGNKIVPVLVFDQFEEIFTQGLAGDETRAATQGFLGELAELVENRPPEALEQAIESDPGLVEKFLFDRRDYRVVLALREDFLASLETLRRRAPSIGRNRYRLRRMTGREGLDAILNPVPRLVAPEVAEEIIRFIGLASPGDAFGVDSTGEATEGFEVEPSLLSLVCRELNERRLARGLDQISADLLAGSRDNIIEEFYERSVADQPAALRAFVEDQLLSASGFRESITLDSARRALSDAGIPVDVLDELVRRRLLRVDERFGIPRVEIIHDVLTPVIRRRRDSSRLRQAEALAGEREAALRRERQRVRRAYSLTAAMALLVAVTIGVAWWGWSAKLDAELQRNAANEQRNLAEQQRTYAERQRAAAEAANERAENNFDLAVTAADTIASTAAKLAGNRTGVSSTTIKEILASAERAFDQIAVAAPDSAYLRWRRAVMLISFAATYQALGDTPEALVRAQTARAIMLSLTQEDPTNTAWWQTLASSNTQVGDVFRGQGDLAAALAKYRSSIEIIQRLVKREPEDTDLQYNLSISHNKIADVLSDEGDLAAALAERRASIDILQSLTEKDAGNANWQAALQETARKIAESAIDEKRKK
jgi:hypothetical protein